MWPSLSAANQIADWANIFFIGSLVVGVVSTVVIVWMANVKEGYWELARQASDERIASLVTQGDQLRKDTAEANAKALDARLELEKFKAPRTLTPEQEKLITSELKSFAGTQFDGAWTSLDPEIDLIFTSIERALVDAGWKGIPFAGSGLIYNRGEYISVGQANAFGVLVNISPSNPELAFAALALVKALSDEGIAAGFQQKAGFVSTNPNTIHIMIGPKR